MRKRQEKPKKTKRHRHRIGPTRNVDDRRALHRMQRPDQRRQKRDPRPRSGFPVAQPREILPRKKRARPPPRACQRMLTR